MPTKPTRPTRPDDPQRRQLDDIHHDLLQIHKALIDHERTRYEKVHGPLSGPSHFLQVLIHDPWFAWLHAISELAVQIDEFTSSRTPTDPKEGNALLTKARELIVPDQAGGEFQREYSRALNESPEAARAHEEWKLARAHNT